MTTVRKGCAVAMTLNFSQQRSESCTSTLRKVNKQQSVYVNHPSFLLNQCYCFINVLCLIYVNYAACRCGRNRLVP